MKRTSQVQRLGVMFEPIEERIVRLDGTLIDIEVTGTTIKHEGRPAFLMIYHDITERKKSEQRLSRMAYYDALTELPNRRLFRERLQQSLKEAQRYNRKLAVMYLDMDQFKQVNDTFGHDVGDELLKRFAQKIKACLRDVDTIARHGGDEFTILLSHIREEKDAIHIAERISSILSYRMLPIWRCMRVRHRYL